MSINKFYIMSTFFMMSLNALVSYELMIDSKGKLVLVYGDYQNEEYDSMNARHVRRNFL